MASEVTKEDSAYPALYSTWQREGNPGSLTWSGYSWSTVNRNGELVFISMGQLSQMDNALSSNSFGTREIAAPETFKGPAPEEAVPEKAPKKARAVKAKAPPQEPADG